MLMLFSSLKKQMYHTSAGSSFQKMFLSLCVHIYYLWILDCSGNKKAISICHQLNINWEMLVSFSSVQLIFFISPSMLT